MIKRFSFTLTKEEEKIFQEIRKKLICRNFAEVIRFLVKKFYIEEFPEYIKLAKGKKVNPYAGMTNKEYCISVLKGKVKDDTCVFPSNSEALKPENFDNEGGVWTTAPLETIKLNKPIEE